MNQSTSIEPRPTIKNVQINWTDELAKKILNNYSNWEQNSDDETLKKDLEKCFEKIQTRGIHSENGFTLAVFLTEEAGMDGDEDLVEILSQMIDLSRNLLKHKIKEWVKTNNLHIPENVLGQYVKAKSGFRTIEGPIVNIVQEEHLVWIGRPGQSIEKKSGSVVEWELIVNDEDSV
jgi:thiamine phosphate synthase YjbQ (UPF0047 family)